MPQPRYFVSSAYFCDWREAGWRKGCVLYRINNVICVFELQLLIESFVNKHTTHCTNTYSPTVFVVVLPPPIPFIPARGNVSILCNAWNRSWARAFSSRQRWRRNKNKSKEKKKQQIDGEQALVLFSYYIWIRKCLSRWVCVLWAIKS